MARNTTSTQDPEVTVTGTEEQQESVVEQQAGSTTAEEAAEETETIIEESQAETSSVSVQLLLTKDEESKLSDEAEEGWTVEGVAVSDGQHSIVVALEEAQSAFGCVESQDEETGVASPSMSDYDGEMRTDFLIGFYNATEGALVVAKEYGWLPSGGEIKMIYDNKEAINAKLEAAGGDLLTDSEYWTSQKFSNERIWSINMEDGTFSIDRGCVSELIVRSVKSLNI